MCKGFYGLSYINDLLLLGITHGTHPQERHCLSLMSLLMNFRAKHFTQNFDSEISA